jgi:hypothetical protein
MLRSIDDNGKKKDLLDKKYTKNGINKEKDIVEKRYVETIIKRRMLWIKS